MTRKKIRGYGKKHPQFFESLDNWCSITEKANWRNFHDVKNSFNSRMLLVKIYMCSMYAEIS